MSILISVLNCFDYCSFKLSFKIGKFELYNLVLVFQDYFDYSVSWEINISLSISAKKSARISIRIAFHLSANLESIAILSISSDYIATFSDRVEIPNLPHLLTGG